MEAKNDLTEKPTAKQIFNRYFKTRLVIFLTLFIIATVGRYFNIHKIEWDFALWTFLGVLFVVAVLGTMDYYFREKEAPKIVSKLLSESPLAEFKNFGFVCEDNNKICGYINEYHTSLAPMVNSERDAYLTILIVIQIKEGLEEYFSKFDEHFKFIFSGEVVFAQALIKDYKKAFDFDKLYNMIENTTALLKARHILAMEIIED